MIDLHNKSPKLLVIGDLMIDQYLWGTCERISPEAPVQIVGVFVTLETPSEKNAADLSSKIIFKLK